jgi:hypothetical protein
MVNLATYDPTALLTKIRVLGELLKPTDLIINNIEKVKFEVCKHLKNFKISSP